MNLLLYHLQGGQEAPDVLWDSFLQSLQGACIMLRLYMENWDGYSSAEEHLIADQEVCCSNAPLCVTGDKSVC